MRRLHPCPRFVRKGGLLCSAYAAWLKRETNRLRERDRDWLTRPKEAAYIAALHKAVVESKGCDFYTGTPLQWRLLARPRRRTTGRRGHVSEGRRPSVDHVHGIHSLQFRMCEANVNAAKGPLTDRQFLRLCKAVTDHHETSQPRSWWRCFTWWRFTQPMKARCQSAGVRS